MSTLRKAALCPPGLASSSINGEVLVERIIEGVPKCSRQAFLRAVTKRQKMRLKEFEETPPEGRQVEYLGRQFVVYRDVFWAFYDNPILDNIQKIVKPRQSVLDVGTGTGIMAIFAAYEGAAHVLAIDINEAALRSAKDNVTRHDFDGIIEVRFSDMFSMITADEQFDIIIGNLPFRNKRARSEIEAAMWDTNLRTYQAFFAGLDKHLRPGPESRAYLCQSNFGAVEEIIKLAEKAGFSLSLFATKTYSPDHELYPCEFYVYEIKKDPLIYIATVSQPFITR